jgi:hypothetical protein
LDSPQADGFRKTVAKEFQEIWLIDLMSDMRKNPKISGTKHNIFGIQAGVTIAFLVRTASLSPFDCEIHYLSLDDFLLATEKRAWLKHNVWQGQGSLKGLRRICAAISLIKRMNMKIGIAGCRLRVRRRRRRKTERFLNCIRWV